MPNELAFRSPLHQMTQTTATCLWNDSAAEAELRLLDRARRRRRHVQSGDRARGAEEGEALWKRAHRGAGGRDADGDGRRRSPGGSSKRCPRGAPRMLMPIFEAERAGTGGSRSRPTLASTGTVQAIVEQALQVQRARAEHDREDPRDARGHRGHRGGDRPRRQHQRHGVLLGAAGHCRGRGGRARPAAARARRARTSAPWDRCAPSWSAGSTTG